jgi:Ca2+:H+ antiporter
LAKIRGTQVRNAMNYLSLLLVFIPIAIVADLLHLNAVLVFALSALGIVPLAGVLGKATEELAVYAGSKVGGFLNATFGNAAELIITLVAVQAGLLEVVKASITGSILGNLLLVMGLAMVLGGLKNGVQKFDQLAASNSSAMLALAIIGLGVPAVFSHTIDVVNHNAVEWLSIGVAVVLIVLYFLSLVFSFSSTSRTQEGSLMPGDEILESKPEWSKRKAISVLLGATLFVVVMSEILVGAIEESIATLGLTEFFVGVIIVPIIGNVAEHLVAVQTALKNKMELSMEVAVGSSMQIALFVAPLLVFASILLGNPMTLIFNQFELIALGAAVAITALISLDGRSHWMEGAQLLAVYTIIALAFFFLPAI